MAPLPDIEQVSEQLERTAGWLAVVAGVVVATWQRFKTLARAIVIANDFNTHFGPQAAGTIRSVLDVVSRSQSEQQVRQKIAERHLRLGIYICGKDGQCTYANEWLCEHFGIDSTRMIGMGWLDAVAAVDKQRVFQEWVNAVENGLPYRTSYMVHNRQSDETWQARTEAFAVNRGGQVVFYVGYVVEDDQGG